MLIAVNLPLTRDTFFIDGQWVAPSSSGRIEVISPRSEVVVGSVPEGQPADIDRAVAAARKAFDSGSWPRMSVEERAVVMRRIAAPHSRG